MLGPASKHRWGGTAWDAVYASDPGATTRARPTGAGRVFDTSSGEDSLKSGREEVLVGAQISRNPELSSPASKAWRRGVTPNRHPGPPERCIFREI